MAVYRDPLEPTPLEEYLNSLGHEVPNPVPVAPPVGFIKQPSMVDHMRQMIRSELLRQEVLAQGIETFEEADDFDIPDDPIDPSTPYEAEFDPPLPVPAEPARTPLVGGAPDVVKLGVPPVVDPPPGAPPVALAAPPKSG